MAEAPAPIPLSVLIRTRNEADRIARTIRSVLPLGAEIVVIDAESTDDTVKIAESLGAKVYVHAWPGFGPQRHWGEERCANDYIFSLDADEIVTPEMAAEIRAVFSQPAPPRLMTIRKALVLPHQDRPPPLGFCHEQVLIYDRRVARTGPNPNWDKLDVSVDDKPRLIRAPLWHYSMRDWNHFTNKVNYVAELAADTQEKRRSRAGLIARLIVEFPVTFVKFYLVRRYFLGGVEGFVMAVISAYGRFLRIAKMLERQDHGRG